MQLGLAQGQAAARPETNEHAPVSMRMHSCTPSSSAYRVPKDFVTNRDPALVTRTLLVNSDLTTCVRVDLPSHGQVLPSWHLPSVLPH